MLDPDPEPHATRSERRRASRLLALVIRRGGGGAAAGLAAASLLLAAASTAFPAVLGATLDALLSGDAGYWTAICASLIAVLVVCDVLDDLAAGVSTARSTAWLRHALLRRLLAAGPAVTRRFSAGDLAGRLVGNAADAGQVATVAIWTTTALLPAVGGAVALVVIDPWLFLTFLVALPLLAPLARVFVRDASALAERYLAVQGRIAGHLADAVAGARTVAAAATADREAARVLAPLPDLHRHGVGMWRVQGRLVAQETVLVALMEIAVLAVAGRLLVDGRISPGELLAAAQYVALATGLGATASAFGRLLRLRAAAGRLAAVLDQPVPRYGTDRLPPEPGPLRFHAVTVRDARGALLLDRLELEVPVGSAVALVGRSGGGKTLVTALAGRLVDPDGGEVTLAGVRLDRLDHAGLRAAVSYGFERPVLLGDSVADAIGLGLPPVDQERLRAAARLARIDDVLLRLPAGYRTRVEDLRLSGGELQRVGLARAFVRPARLLILDDVAASLDSATEHHISAALTGPMSDRIRLVVAHRASTAARVDLVAWLEAGRVRALGPHRDLWRDPDYRAVFEPAAPPAGGPADEPVAAGPAAPEPAVLS